MSPQAWPYGSVPELRLFVGVFPPARALADLRAALPAQAKLTAMDRWHLTLVFLGEVADEREVSAVLAKVSAPREIRLRLAGGGAFGNGRSAVLWAGVEGDVQRLSELQQDLRGALTAAGLPSDDRPYRPHLTVSYRAVSERAVSDRAVSDRAVSDRAVSDRAVSDRAVSERAVSERAVSDRDREEVRTSLTAYRGPAWSVDEYVLVRSHHEDGGGYDQLNSWPC